MRGIERTLGRLKSEVSVQSSCRSHQNRTVPTYPPSPKPSQAALRRFRGSWLLFIGMGIGLKGSEMGGLCIESMLSFEPIDAARHLLLAPDPSSAKNAESPIFKHSPRFTPRAEHGSKCMLSVWGRGHRRAESAFGRWNLKPHPCLKVHPISTYP